MLKKFFMNTLSSFVGAWLALVLFGVVAAIVCVGIVAKIGASSAENSVKKGSVLSIALSGKIVETELPVDLDYMSLIEGSMEKPQSLSGLVTAIAEAKENKDIDAIYLDCKGVSASPATLNALRNAILDFKESKKKVIAYGGNISNGDYYVASAADKILMNPAGQLELQGLGGTNFYFKELLDKLGVTIQVVKVGTYKSAVEPYILNEISAPARAQLDTLYGNMWSLMRENISATRKKLTPAKIDSIVSRDLVFTQPSSFSVKNGLVDALVYERSVDSVVAATLGKDKDDLNYVSASMLTAQTNWGQAYKSKKQIAVLYACGEILDGGGSGTINYENLVPQIVDLADDDNVKGMVLRVNSPGGAVYGSDQIGEALDYFKSKGKPYAVSMGDYAASGGYWISCCSDRIFADPLTITGSIGIFGLIPSFKGLADKLGVTPQVVCTNPEAKFPNLFTPMTEEQTAAMQKYVERGYDQFVGRVATGRKMPESKVRQIGEGRVWDAQKAVEIGLVDELGSLDDAIKWIAGKTKLEDEYDVATYPSFEQNVWNMIPELGGMKLENALVKVLKEDYDDIMARFAANVLRQKPLQARMPYIDVRL